MLTKQKEKYTHSCHGYTLNSSRGRLNFFCFTHMTLSYQVNRSVEQKIVLVKNIFQQTREFSVPNWSYLQVLAHKKQFTMTHSPRILQ